MNQILWSPGLIEIEEGAGIDRRGTRPKISVEKAMPDKRTLYLYNS